MVKYLWCLVKTKLNVKTQIHLPERHLTRETQEIHREQCATFVPLRSTSTRGAPCLKQQVGRAGGPLPSTRFRLKTDMGGLSQAWRKLKTKACRAGPGQCSNPLFPVFLMSFGAFFRTQEAKTSPETRNRTNTIPYGTEAGAAG